MMAEKQTYPMISEKNWWELRNQFKKTIPTSVNPSYVKSLLGFNSDESAKTNIITPLRQLGIIDDEGKPTDLAKEWRSDDKYANACKTMLDAIYPQELKDLFPEESIDAGKVKTWFMDTAAIGDSAASKVTKIYVLLRSAKVKQDSEKKSSSTRKTVQNKTSRAKTNTSENAVSEKREAPADSMDGNQTTPALHIDIQVHIAPDAPAEQIEKIFESMAKYLYRRNS